MKDIVIVSDYPRPGDPEKQLKDGYGRFFWHLMVKAGVPKGVKIEFAYKTEMDYWKGSHRFFAITSKYKDAVFVPLGSKVLPFFEIEGKVNKNRGSVFKYKSSWVVPTYHPNELKEPMRMFAESAVAKAYWALADLRKAISIYYNGWEVPKERFITAPSLEDVEKFYAFWKKEDPLLAGDLEGTGLNLEYADIFVHGFAWTEEDAICIPILKEGGRRYWSYSEEKRVKEILDDIYANGRLMFQNGVGYDVPLLRQRGYNMQLKAFFMDTMVMHHVLDPEAPHNIGFISSVHGKTSYWKESFISKGESIQETDQEEMRIYNCRDCVALHQIYNSMLKQMEFLKVDKRYDNLPALLDQGMEASRLSVKMYEKGFLLDKNTEREWKKYLDENYKEVTEKLYKDFDLPDSFNMNSPKHKAYWIYGEELPFDKDELLEEIATYDAKAFNYQYECTTCGRKVTKKFFENQEVPNARQQKCPACKDIRRVIRTEKERTPVKPRSKMSKKYLELTEKKALLDVEPLYRLKGYSPLQTKSNASALDSSAMVRYTINLNTRIDKIANMKRRLAKHDEELKGLIRTRSAIAAVQEYSKAEKLRSSFYQFNTWKDGRVRAQALVTGTATGRWSYKKPNLQQLPSGPVGEKCRACFRAPKAQSFCRLTSQTLR